MARNNFVNESGSCEKCEDYKVQSGDKQSCIDAVCPPTKKIETDGSCSNCPNYTSVNTD